MNYIVDFGEKGKFTPDKRVGDSIDVEAHNNQVEREELEGWNTAPSRWGGYIKLTNDPMVRASITLTTWRGHVLGTGKITGEYRNNFGARIRCVVIRGTNGYEYSGRYGYDGGDFIRLKRGKPFPARKGRR